MDQQTQSRTSGSYTANLLGNIRSHLAGLQGYDVMALELIQNADDAKAESVAFDITDQGLFVVNSGRFTYCGNLHASPCGFMARDDFSCDYHRIKDVGSGGKLSRADNIGRFGIGFVSTYQVTDHPQIRSSGVKLTLHPEEGEWLMESFDGPEGTVFFLPWAVDPNSKARLALGVSHLSDIHIDQLADDFQRVLRRSLLFLRHVRTAEVRRNGKLLLACDLDRGDGNELIVSFRPSGEVEQWHIMRTDAAPSAARLYASHPRLEWLGRGTKISIAFRIEPDALDEGVLYAFLPTEQPLGLPIHINADFFPESDRKAIIFAGHQHEQAWNEMLIDVAASELAKNPESLMKLIGHKQLWRILGHALDLSKSSAHPRCFARFWERLKASAAQACIAPAQDGSVQPPRGVFFSDKALDAAQLAALREIGGLVVDDGLRPFRAVMLQLDAPLLTLDRLVTLFQQAAMKQIIKPGKVEAQRLMNFYRPLWAALNEFLPDAYTVVTNATIARLKPVPIVITENLNAVSFDNSVAVPVSLGACPVAQLLPGLAVAARAMFDHPKVARLIQRLTLTVVVNHIRSKCVSETIENVIPVDRAALRELYTMFAELDRLGDVEKKVYQALRDLPIWLSSRGLIKAAEALLPGNFKDPTGRADLLDTSVLTDHARTFVSGKLGILTQTIEAFVQNVLPRFFENEGPLDQDNFFRLITELARHPELVNNDDIRKLLGSLPIVPTQDGAWSRPTSTYRRTEDLVKVLGDAKHLWLDDGRMPVAVTVRTFVDSIGIRRSPSAQHLVERMDFIAKNHSPTEEAKRASGEAFYVLCDHYDEWKTKPFFKSAIAELRALTCFPVAGDTESWHSAKSLYAPYRAEAFNSQARILDFRNTTRLKTEVLEDLGIVINPGTKLVIEHLQHCMSMCVQPHVSTYQVLNERAQRFDPLVATLIDTRCIYVEQQQTFVRPNQLFWSAQQLGKYTFTVPANLDTFKPLFKAIGVKDAPKGEDYVAILLDIVGEHFKQSRPVFGSDRAVYDACLAGAAAADERGELGESELEKLRETPTMLNLSSRPTFPDEVLLQDSEWHAGFFNGELNGALCKATAELWPFIEKIGVRRLSESAEIALEYTEGTPSEETPIAVALTERSGLFARLFHDKPAAVHKNVRNVLAELHAVSYDLVRIQASVEIGDDRVPAPHAAVQAFYDLDKRQLVLARPVVDRSWPHILNAIFHQLLPETTGSEISKLTLSVRPLMNMQLEDAHRELTDAGIPSLDSEQEQEEPDDLTSPSLIDLGSPDESDAQPNGESDTTPPVAPERPEPARPGGEQEPKPGDKKRFEQEQSGTGTPDAPKENADPDADDRSSRHGKGKDASAAGKKTNKSRPQHKEQWDRRLLSYVRKRQEGAKDSDEDGNGMEGLSEHNLAVEVVARTAVCEYEQKRGRVAEQMAQTHPGYDIISRNPLTGELRYIEVKGVNGEWNQTGVGLSRLQFSNAQTLGDHYWLYVVEFVSDHHQTRVHSIQSPATQVTSFMFDGNWRGAVDDERADPSHAFIAGARVRHQDFGLGRINTIEMRGSTRLMLIDFENDESRKMPLNLHTMKIVGDDDGNDPS